MSGSYGNVPGLNEDPAKLRFGDNYERMVDCKTEYDPENRFGEPVTPRTESD